MRKFKRQLKLEKILYGIMAFAFSIVAVLIIGKAIFLIVTGQAKYGMTYDEVWYNPIAALIMAILGAVMAGALIEMYQHTKKMEKFIAELEREQEEKNKGNNDDEKRKEEASVHDEKEEK